jgi:pimeloyl-ACP methyl ester carboxylesterase
MVRFLQVGKADGPAVFHFHGHGSSRLEALLVSEQAVSLGVRLIALDRPGIGRSSANEEYRLLDWPNDVSEIADQFGIERFAVEGVSAGGAYALACAYKLPHRLTACGLISTLPPAALLGKAGPLWMRRVLPIAARLPVLFRLYLALLPDPAADERAMEKQLLRYASTLSEADRKLLQTAALRKQLAQAMAESRRKGSRGNRYEARMLVRYWGFKPEEIAFEKIFLWHGQEDRFMPIAAARLLAQKLPHCTAVFYPGDGHFSVLMEHTQDILNALRG